jgi:amidase
MRMPSFHAVIIPLCVSLSALVAVGSQATDSSPLTGEWIFTTVLLGISSSDRLELKSSGSDISGTVRQDGESISITGSIRGQNIEFEFKIGNQEHRFVGTTKGNDLAGTFTWRGKTLSLDGTWSARRAATDKPPSPRTLEFVPTEFHRELSAQATPALRVWPGDSVQTTTVDAGGQDSKSNQRVAGGNPLTGPFYVEGAMPGDVLAVTIKRVRVNRDWAVSSNSLVERALTVNYAAKNKQPWDSVRWHLDADKQVATLENPPDRLKGFAVQLRPMLGCIGVAPGPGDAPISTHDSGYTGGNVDFNRITAGTTVYLRVHQPGALLYVGDGHAVQGDGELNGDALETSMDVEFSVAVLRDKYIGTPRAEDGDYLMAIGLAGSLDDALRIGTSELATWLQADYQLSPAEAAMVLGTSIEYDIAEVADRNVGVVAKIRKNSVSALPH